MLGIDTVARQLLGDMCICFSSVKNENNIRLLGVCTVSATATAEMTVSSVSPVEIHGTSFSYATPDIGKYSMVTWDTFLEDVFPSVQGCPKSMVIHAIRAACIDFCEKTLIWKQDSIANDVVAGEASYSFAPPAGAKVVRPYRIEIIHPDNNNVLELQPMSLETLESFDTRWRVKEERVPQAYVLTHDDTVRLIGIPTETIENGLLAYVSLKPTRTAEECPDFLYEDWAETIAAGALAKLHANEKVWAQPAMVQHYTKIYRDGVSRARSVAAKSWLRESKNILPVGFTNIKGYH